MPVQAWIKSGRCSRVGKNNPVRTRLDTFARDQRAQSHRVGQFQRSPRRIVGLERARGARRGGITLGGGDAHGRGWACDARGAFAARAAAPSLVTRSLN